MNSIALVFIKFYQKIISPLLPGACRYYPSCSEYSMQAFKNYSFIQALWLSSKRIGRCNPFFEGYFDPLPLKKSKGINHYGRKTK